MKNIKALVKNIKGKLIAIASDDSVDRHGDSLNQLDWDLKQFRKNPVLLMSHQYHLAPIGIAKNIKVVDDRLIFEPIFHEITQQASEVKKMFEQGIMKAFSVGFMENAKKKLELLEISAVSVPANANALVFAKSFTPEEEKEIGEWVSKNIKIKKKTIEKKAEYVTKEDFNELFSTIKDINIRLNDINKDRQEPVKDDINHRVVRGLEKLNNQLGYLGRIKKKD